MSFATGSPPPKTKIPGYKQYNIQKYTPQQMEIFNSLAGGVTPGLQGGTDYLSRLASGDQSAFNEIEKPAYNAFEKQLGSIANRFSHLGAMDSNYFENATAGAGRELQENLASNRHNIREQAIQSLLGQANQFLNQNPFESKFIEKEQNPYDLKNLLSPENIGLLLKLLPLLL